MLPDGHCRGYVTSPTATYGGRRRREMPAAYWPPGRTSSGSGSPGLHTRCEARGREPP